MRSGGCPLPPYQHAPAGTRRGLAAASDFGKNLGANPSVLQQHLHLPDPHPAECFWNCCQQEQSLQMPEGRLQISGIHFTEDVFSPWDEVGKPWRLLPSPCALSAWGWMEGASCLSQNDMTLLSLVFLPALSILAAVTYFSCVCFFAG